MTRPLSAYAIPICGLLLACGGLAATSRASEPLAQHSAAISRGLAYLVEHQDESGGWGADVLVGDNPRTLAVLRQIAAVQEMQKNQALAPASNPNPARRTGAGRSNNRRSSSAKRDRESPPSPVPFDPTIFLTRPTLGNTSMATIALVRAGNTTTRGPYAANVARAVNFLADRIEASNGDKLEVAGDADPLVYNKFGPYAETLLAGFALGELRNATGASGDDERARQTLEKIVSKIEKNQRPDGLFAGNAGVVTIFSAAACSKCLNLAAQNSIAVDRDVLDRDFAQACTEIQRCKVKFTNSPEALRAAAVAGRRNASPSKSASSAPAIADTEPLTLATKLYGLSVTASRISDYCTTCTVTASDDASRSAKAREKQQAVNHDLLADAFDPRFLAGFGSNGGEEYLSFSMIGDALRAADDPQFARWNEVITDAVERVQNADGSWTGLHCVMGRTFNTSAALMTLLADRPAARVPARAQAIVPLPKQ